MSSRGLLAAWVAAIALLAACSPPPSKPPGSENCGNGVDDNGDGKTDCADPTCFKSQQCLVRFEVCDNGADEDGNGLTDCDDPACAAAQHCSAPPVEDCQNAVDDDGDGKADCADTDCAGAPACAPTSEAGMCGDGVDNDGDGATDCADTECAGAPACAPTSETGKCNDGLDNDNDGLTDCQDGECAGAPCGDGCSCGSGAKRETGCDDGADNDSDSKIDCADPDCAGAGTEVCDDGRDNTCDRKIDCADPKCAGSGQCSGLADGLPCASNGQCAGGRCLTEAAAGLPNGACSNATSCSVSAQTGCNGGICVEEGSFDVCRMKCTGNGLGTTGRCREGYACLDVDGDSGNANSHCTPLCTADEQCGGSGTGYGCNPWSKLCEQKDKGLLKYGAACTSGGQCESGYCSSGYPGGYCWGLCAGNQKSCGGDGVCYYYPSFGDNVGDCMDGCATSSQCRGSPLTCQDVGQGSVCYCRGTDVSCTAHSQCCSGYCNPYFGLTCD